jgi:hypothetical protein
VYGPLAPEPWRAALAGLADSARVFLTLVDGAA